MDELIHYYSVDVAVTFDIDLDSDQIDTELTSDIHDTFVEELKEAFNNNSDVDLDDYDWDWDKEHDYIQHLYISSKLDKAAVTPIVENILDSIISFERTDELWDGTYYYERHGLDTPPYERVANTRDYTYKVDVDTDILRFFETNEEGDVLQEAVTKNELKDRAKKHAKKQNGLSPFCSLGERLDRKSIDKNRLDIARLLGIPSGGITVNENGRVEIHNIPEEDARRYSNLLRNKVKDIRLIPGKYDFRKVPLPGQVPDRLVTISGMLKDSLNEEALNEVKESRDYKGYEMRADYDVDPEDGIMSLVVHLYKDGKEIQQDAYGRELSFENYKKAREWIDSRTYSLEDKLSQIANELDPYDGNAYVGEDKFGHYISFGESPEAVTRIYVKEDYTYDFVTMEADDYKYLLVDVYDWEKLVGKDWEKILDITNDDDNSIFEIDLPAIVKKYYVPFTNSVLSICSGKGLKNLLKDISGYSCAPDLSNSKRLLNMNRYSVSESKEYKPITKKLHLDENLLLEKTAQKERAFYKGHDLIAEYIIDAEEGNWSFAVTIYKDDKPVPTPKNEFAEPLTFESFKAARAWIDKNVKECPFEVKSEQLIQLLNREDIADRIKVKLNNDDILCILLENDYHVSNQCNERGFLSISKQGKYEIACTGDWPIEDWVPGEFDHYPEDMKKKYFIFDSEGDIADFKEGITHLDILMQEYVPFKTPWLVNKSGNIDYEFIISLEEMPFGDICSSDDVWYDWIDPYIHTLPELDESLTEARRKKKKRLGGTLNPNAGNVEHNINMFNHMNSPIDGPSNNPVSGPFGGDVSVGEASGCCESVVNERYHAPFPENRRDIVREMKLPLNQKFRKIARNSRVTAEFYVLDGGEGLVDVCDKDDGSMVEVGFSTLENALKYCEICCGSSATRARKSLLSDGIYVQLDYNLMSALKPMIESGVKLDPGYDGEAVFIYTESNPEQLIKKYHLSEFDVGNYNGDRVEYYGRSIKKDLGHDIDPRYLEPDTKTSYLDAVVAGHAFRREIADYAQSNDDADYRAGVYENLNDIETNEKVFMEEYDLTNTDTTYTKEVGLNDYFESMNREDNE